MGRSVVGLCCLLCLVVAQAANIKCPPGDKTFVVVGDSLSSAYNMASKFGWVALLRQRLHHYGMPIKTINVSIAGQTSAEALERLPRWLQRYQPDYLMLEIGANDGLRGRSKSYLESQLSAMVNLGHQHGAKVLLVGVRLPPNYGKFYLDGLAQAYQQVAAEHHILYEPKILQGVSGHLEKMQLDRLHPKAMAQPEILNHLWPKLLQLFGCVVVEAKH